MWVVMAVMIVAMLSLGHGPIGESKHESKTHEHNHGHEAHHKDHDHSAGAKK